MKLFTLVKGFSRAENVINLKCRAEKLMSSLIRRGAHLLRGESISNLSNCFRIAAARLKISEGISESFTLDNFYWNSILRNWSLSKKVNQNVKPLELKKKSWKERTQVGEKF